MPTTPTVCGEGAEPATWIRLHLGRLLWPPWHLLTQTQAAAVSLPCFLMAGVEALKSLSAANTYRECLIPALPRVIPL